MMNDYNLHFTTMLDNAQQLYALATLLRLADVFATGDESLIESTTTIMQEKSHELASMIEAAQAIAQDLKA